MLRNILRISTIAMLLPASTYAGEAENIMACIKAVKSYSGKMVDEFDVNYKGKIINFSIAKWPGIECEVAFSEVYNLNVDGEVFVIDGFAGMDAKIAYEASATETADAISLLESRISLLKQRLDKAKTQLSQPSPLIDDIQEYVRNGIVKATGK